jgi:hypothetical protein
LQQANWRKIYSRASSGVLEKGKLPPSGFKPIAIGGIFVYPNPFLANLEAGHLTGSLEEPKSNSSRWSKFDSLY